MKNFAVKTIVAIGIGAALFFVLSTYIAIPTPIPNLKLSVHYPVIGVMAMLFGPLAGCLMGLIAPGLDILIYNEPVEKIFLQGAVGSVGNILSTAVVGTILCFAYASTRAKKGSLKKED